MESPLLVRLLAQGEKIQDLAIAHLWMTRVTRRKKLTLMWREAACVRDFAHGGGFNR